MDNFQKCIKTNIELEIIDLHQFFQDWFTGKIPESRTAFSRLEKSIDSKFYLVTPDGLIYGFKNVIENIFNSYSKKSSIRIKIKNIGIRILTEDLFIATYEECQIIEGKCSTRLCSAVLRVDPKAPNNISWIHLHETWITKS